MATLGERRFTVRYTREDDGYWSSEVVEQPGSRSFGRSLSEAQRRTRQALAGWLEAFENIEVPDPTALDLVDEIAVDFTDEQIDLVSLRQRRHDLEQLRTQVAKDTTVAATALLRRHPDRTPGSYRSGEGRLTIRGSVLLRRPTGRRWPPSAE